MSVWILQLKRKVKLMNNKLVELVIIADKSGSMEQTIKEARQSLNKFIDSQRDKDYDVNVTFVTFSDEVNEI